MLLPRVLLLGLLVASAQTQQGLPPCADDAALCGSHGQAVRNRHCEERGLGQPCERAAGGPGCYCAAGSDGTDCSAARPCGPAPGTAAAAQEAGPSAASGVAEHATESVVAENYPVAIALDVAGAATYSAGLILQRYSLSAASDRAGRVDIFSVSVPRNLGWLLGLATYSAGNAIYTVAMQYAPVSLITTVFVAVLVINGALSHRVLGESVDRDGLAIKVILMTFVDCYASGRA